MSEIEKIEKEIKYAVYYDKRNPLIHIHRIGVHKLFHGERTFDKPVDAWSFFSNIEDARLFANAIHDVYPKLPLTQCSYCKI